jgi:hypothetical protein
VKTGDLVRYQQGSLDKIGIVIKQWQHTGDYMIEFVDGTCAPCRPRTLEIINESR